MGTWTHLCSGDWRNNGWALNGSGVGACWQALDNDDDSKFISCPGSKGDATVSFPIDITGVPTGAVITSITIMCRASTGAGVPPAGTPNSITIQVPCSDDVAQFTTRTIYPVGLIAGTPGTPVTFTVATYRRDARGFDWDIERVNHFLCRVSSSNGVADSVRCFKLFAVINYRLAPTVTVTAPSGTVFTPSPVISWVYAQTDGDQQSHAEYKLFTAVQVNDVAFNPETAPPVFYGTVTGDVPSVTLPTSIDPDNYSAYVRVYSSFQAKSGWVGRQFTVDGPSPGTPGVADPTGNALPGVGIIAVVPDGVTGSATLTLNDTSNLLSVQAADAETTDGESFATTNCTFTQDSSQAFPGGSSSWKMKASSAANMTATSNWTEVSPSVPVTARAQFLTIVTARTCKIRVLFFDANFVTVGGTLTSPTITDSTSTWTEAVVTGTTPATAVYAQVALDVLAPANAEVHNVDHTGLMYGTSTPWSDGGHMSRNLLSSWYSNAEGTAPSGQSWVAGTAASTSTASPPGTGGSGALCNTMTYLGLTPTLGFRATGSVFTTPTSGTDYTLNLPATTASGDLMIAYVASSTNATITPPTGWTAVDSAGSSIDGTKDSVLWVLKRTAGASEPSTWTGSVSASSARRQAVVVSYQGAADASLQFLAEGAAATANTQPDYITSPSVFNTDPNAWRAFATVVNDDATGGTLTANLQPPSTVPAIQYVASAGPWKDASGGTTYFINKPANVISGDLMIAVVAISGSGLTISAPTGWTVVRQQGNSNGQIQQAVLKRTAGASEPTAWSGTVSGTLFHPKVTQVVAYRNCADASLQFLAEAGSAFNNGQTLNTASVTNTNSLAWRVCGFSSFANDEDVSWTSTTETSTRRNDTADSSQFTDSVSCAVVDSNGSVGTGSYQRSATTNRGFDGAVSWMGFIKPLAAPPAGVGNETSRAVTTVGSANPWLTLGAFDSNGVVAVGNTSVNGVFAPSDADASWRSAAAWIGIIKPAVPVRSGYVGATMATTVDVSAIDPSIPVLAGGQVTATAAFIGSTAGTPYLSVNFYRANQLLNTFIAAGTSFGTATWQKSAATFTVPAGTTRMNIAVAVADRNVSDVVYFDRVSLAYGADVVWRPGTSRAAHAVWAVPQIQYADDDGSGYTPWQTLPGLVANPPSYDALSGLVTYVDHTVVPLTNRKYRAQTASFGLAGDMFVSGYGPESSEINFVASNWWLKDISDPDSNLQLKVKWDTVSVGTTNTATVLQPLGEDLPIVLTEGYKSDQFVVNMVPVNHADFVQLKSLLTSGRTLFLQSDVDQAWWVRPVSDLTSDIMPSGQRQSNPQREIKTTFVQVAPVP